MSRAALALVLGLSACSTGAFNTVGSGSLTHATLSIAPEADARGWRRLTTPDFELSTDLGPVQAAEAAQLIGEALTGLRALFGDAPRLRHVPVKVFAMADGMDFERRFGAGTWGFAAPRADETVLVLYGPPQKWFRRAVNASANTESVLEHELAHAVLAEYFPEQPRWFAEGMASWLETFRWASAHAIRLGDPGLSVWANYREYRAVTVKDMLAWGQSLKPSRDSVELALYGQAWAFVHWATNREQRLFSSYLSLLADHGPRVAWENTFAPREATLDQEIYGFIKAGEYAFREVPVADAPLRPAHFEPLPPELVNPALDELSSYFRRPR